MRTTGLGPDHGAPAGVDPLGSAARLRQARLDPDVLADRVLHVGVDAVVLTLLLALPALVATLATLLVDVPVAVPLLAVVAAVLVTVTGVAVTWPHHDGGRTAGMRWVRLRVVDARGGAPSRAALAVRALLLPVDVVVGLPLVLLRADRRRLGDLLAGTQVVRDLSAAAAAAPRPGTATSPRAPWRPADVARPR
ncbi:RDD family protein [Aquipuribacter sp. MA13-6]|uniref:RDD family protein n=1 Tax=unclassified Aquipuribacter TaxID=2635084 RepID=UPI003EE9103A